MRITSRYFVAPTVGLLALSLVACSSPAVGESTEDGPVETTTLRLALNQTEEHPSFIALDAFGERLLEATDGRWDIEVFPNETLGAQAETLQLVGDGVVDMAIVSGAQLENLSKDFIAFNLPTVFDSVEHQISVVNDPEITGDLYSSLADSNNVSVVGGFTQGARSVYTKNAPVESPKDLAGQKIRVQESELFLSLVESLGASPTPMAFGEVYTALQSGVIDGAENNEVSYFTQKHHEVAPFFSYTEHLIGLDYLIINSAKLDGLTDEDRSAFDEAWAATYEQHTELWTEATDKAIVDAEAAGATFTEVDSDAFIEALEPIVEQFLTEPSQQKLYDAARDASEK
ncbi:TRAP transporter substrate-binding protein [Mycetocola sp. 2940]|uniref:TRAP transporter substrate-binding protein n=1 Tax=Mycetocola sp. 2940 TaxID=3156452 RepID=UPI0033937F08